MITLDEITPEKILELEFERDARRSKLVNRLSVERLCERVRAAERELEHATTCRQLRARSMRAEGMTLAEIADWFGMSVSAVRGWLKADVEVQLSSKGWGYVE